MTPEERADKLVHIVPPDPTGQTGPFYFDLALVSICGKEPFVANLEIFRRLRDAIAEEIRDAASKQETK